LAFELPSTESPLISTNLRESLRISSGAEGEI
jgi:hypothetical protein